MKIKLQQVDESFGQDEAASCDLLIRINREQFDFAVLDSGHQLRALSEVQAAPENFGKVVSSIPLLNYPYRKVVIGMGTRKFTFIPGAIYAHDQLKTYARFIRPEKSSDLLVTAIPGFGIRNLAAVTTELQQSVRTHFPESAISSQLDPFLTGVHRQIHGDETCWHFNLGARSFEAALVQKGELLFCNVFEASGPDDFNYFLLLLLKQFPDSGKARVVVSGTITATDPYYLRLKKYFSHIEPADMRWVTRSETFAGVSLFHYYTLLNLALCG